AVVGEGELRGARAEVEAHRVAPAKRIRLRARAVGVKAADLGIAGRRLADVAGRADADIELVVGTDRQKLPAMGAMVREVAVDHDGLGRAVEIVLYLFELRNLGAFGDVERAVLEGETIRAVEPGGNHLG